MDRMQLSWSNVDIEVPNKNSRYSKKRLKLISDACGSATQGILAIMGPSGSGKTTLLNALVGRVPEGSKTAGEILFNGKERDKYEWTNKIGYVDQDDSFFEELKVTETMEIAAKFKTNYEPEQRKEKIYSILQNLAIEHVAECPMKNLSGGERKRVMVAIELITDPCVILLDEPTSGLDNNTGCKLIRLLKKLANEGRIVIFTIHQPDEMMASEFDKLLLLSQGKTVYMGDFDKCESYLSDHGIKRLPKQSFSNYVMNAFDIGPANYHDHIENKKLNLLVQNVLDEYLINPKNKNPRKSNEYLMIFKPNMKAVSILLERRVKMLFFRKKECLSLFFNCLSSIATCYFIKYRLPVNSDGPESKKILILLFPFVTNIQILVSISCILFAYKLEKKQIKREIGVSRYSIGSYYLSIFIYELIIAAIPVTIYILVFLSIISKELYEWSDFFYPILGMLELIPFFLFIISIFDSIRSNMVLFYSCAFLNLFPIGFIIAFIKTYRMTRIHNPFLLILNILPVFVVSNMDYYQKIRYLLENCEHNIERSSVKDNFKKMDLFENKEMLALLMENLSANYLGFPININFGYLIYVIFFIIFVFSGLYCIARRLRPSTRFKLNK